MPTIGAAPAQPAVQPQPPVLTTVPAEATTRAGFTPAGQPLPDNQVWGLFVGKRAVNTATAQSAKGEKIDGWERKKLAELAAKDPQAFLQRLHADSSNGTPVDFALVKTLKNFGVGRVDFHAENGKIEARASVEIFNKRADGFLKPYMAQGGREKGMRSTIALTLAGQLNAAGGIDGVKLEASATGIPKLSADKLMKLDEAKKELRKALGSKELSAKERNAKITGLFDELVKDMAEMPLAFFVKLVTDHDELEIDVKEKGHSLKAHAEVGKGDYAITFTDLLTDSDSTKEPKLGARVAGKATEAGTISVDEVKIGTERPLSVAFEAVEGSETKRPVVYETNPKTGKKVRVNEHLGELPLALALIASGGEGIF